MMFSHFRMNEGSEDVNRILYCVWVTVIGEIWKQINKKAFNNGRIDHMEIFTMAQSQVWSWVTSKVRFTCFSYSLVFRIIDLHDEVNQKRKLEGQGWVEQDCFRLEMVFL